MQVRIAEIWCRLAQILFIIIMINIRHTRSANFFVKLRSSYKQYLHRVIKKRSLRLRVAHGVYIISNSYYVSHTYNYNHYATPLSFETSACTVVERNHARSNMLMRSPTVTSIYCRRHRSTPCVPQIFCRIYRYVSEFIKATR